MARVSTVSSAGAGLLVALSCASVEARQPVGTPDVYLLAQTIQGEIEVVRWYTGRPLEQNP
jgi:hypothetical protein